MKLARVLQNPSLCFYDQNVSTKKSSNGARIEDSWFLPGMSYFVYDGLFPSEGKKDWDLKSSEQNIGSHQDLKK